MTPTPRNNPKNRPWTPGDEEAQSFGNWLRQQREVREITLREIADASKISFRYLEAFEQDRFDVLPAGIFARGFLRQYARYVGLDGDDVVNRYLSAQQSLEPEEDGPEAAAGATRRNNHWLITVLLVLALLIALALVALAGFYSERKRQGNESDQTRSSAPAPSQAVGSPPRPDPVAAPTQEPARGLPAETVETSSPSPAPLQVELAVTENCWAVIRVDGQRHLQRELTTGERLSLEAQDAVVLTLGNAGGVQVRVNGQPYPLDQGRGQVVRDMRIDLDTVRSLPEAS